MSRKKENEHPNKQKMKEWEEERNRKEAIHKEMQRQAYMEHAEKRQNIGNERRISTPGGTSKSTDVMHGRNQAERQRELQKLKDLKVVSKGAEKRKMEELEKHGVVAKDKKKPKQ
ncbi:MAG: hypothetical protein AB7V32_01415 [Candidatus Berkiella sp.]